jgi:four helix bundle protein
MKRRKGRRDFRNVRIFQRAMDSAMEIFHLFRRFPEHEEQEELAGDVVRASRVVCAKIAAAYETRDNPDMCLTNLKLAKTQAAETLVFLELANSLGYIDASQRDYLMALYEELLDRLGKLVTRWQERAHDFLDRYGPMDEE